MLHGRTDTTPEETRASMTASSMLKAFGLITLSITLGLSVQKYAFHPPEWISNYLIEDIVHDCLADHRPRMEWIDQVSDWIGGGDLLCILVAFWRAYFDEGKWIARGIFLVFVGVLSALLEMWYFPTNRSGLLPTWIPVLGLFTAQFMGIGVIFPLLYVPLFIIDRFFLKKTLRRTSRAALIYRQFVTIQIAIITLAMTLLPINSNSWQPICVLFQYIPLALIPLIFVPSSASPPSTLRTISFLSTLLHISGLTLLIYGFYLNYTQPLPVKKGREPSNPGGQWNDTLLFILADMFGALGGMFFVRLAHVWSGEGYRKGIKGWRVSFWRTIFFGPGKGALEWVERTCGVYAADKKVN